MLICFIFCKKCYSASQYISYVGCLYRRWIKCLQNRNRFNLARTKIRKAIVSNSNFLPQRSTFTKFYNDLPLFICLTFIPQRVFLWLRAIKYISVLQCMTQLGPLMLQKVTYNGPICSCFSSQ